MCTRNCQNDSYVLFIWTTRWYDSRVDLVNIEDELLNVQDNVVSENSCAHSASASADMAMVHNKAASTGLKEWFLQYSPKNIRKTLGTAGHNITGTHSHDSMSRVVHRSQAGHHQRQRTLLCKVIRRHTQTSPEAGATRPSQHTNGCTIRQNCLVRGPHSALSERHSQRWPV
jgi:hypothetical protein